MSILTEGITLARLKCSIGREHTNPRPLTPIEVARHMQEIKYALNDSSGSLTAKRLGVSTAIISDFMSLLHAPRKYDDYWGWGKFNGGRLPFSMCRRLGKFYSKNILNEEEFGALVDAVQNEKIPVSAAEEIAYLKKKNREKTFIDCFKEISNMTPQVVRSIVFITDINENTVENLRKTAQEKSVTIEEFMKFILGKYIGNENIDGVLIKKEKYLKIAFNEAGRKKLDEVSTKEKIPLSGIINHICSREGV